MHKFQILTITACVILLGACKHTTKDMIVGKWRGVEAFDPQDDSATQQMKIYIDTLGSSKDPMVNLSIYGTTNIDSIKNYLRNEMNSLKQVRSNALHNTIFSFKSNGVAELDFNGKKNTSSWTVDSSSTLRLIDKDGDTKGQEITAKILTVTDSMLKMKFIEAGHTSDVTFHKEKK